MAPMTKERREEVMVGLKPQMSIMFGKHLSEHDLLIARESSYEIAKRHHTATPFESIVVHVDIVPCKDDFLSVLDYGSATRHTVRITDDEDTVIQDMGRRSPQFGNALVHSLKAFRIPARLKTTKLAECYCCGCYHPVDFEGECRDDGNRFPPPNDPDDEAF